MHWLAEQAPKYAKDYLTKLRRLTPSRIREGAKIIFRLVGLTQRQLLKTYQRAQSNREKLQKCVKFDSG